MRAPPVSAAVSAPVERASEAAPVERTNEAAPPAQHAHAESVFDHIAEKPGAYDLFQAMRRIEAAHPERPLFGEAQRPGEEPIRFTQEPALTFAPSAIVALERGGPRPPRLMQRVFGYMGPNGALPIHLTEYVRERILHHGDTTLARFLDTLVHRFGLFFYRAWARSQPTVCLDRPRDAAISRHLGALFGNAEKSTRERDALGDFSKLFFAGRLARSVRDADGLQAWVQLQFGVPVQVQQFSGHWMPLGDAERSRLTRHGQAGVGRGAVLGRAVWDVQHKFRIVIGPLPWERFNALLPGGVPLDQLQAMVRQYVGFEFNWDLRLILKRQDVPSWRLGAERSVGRLGRTAWINGGRAYQRSRDADDLVMNVESIRSAAGVRRSPIGVN